MTEREIRRYTYDDDRELLGLRAGKATPSEIAREVGRSYSSVRSRLEYLKALEPRAARRLLATLIASPPLVPVQSHSPNSVPDLRLQQLEADRALREAAMDRRDRAYHAFGDPPPGYSALDRRTAQ
jgi:hypothetical protein